MHKVAAVRMGIGSASHRFGLREDLIIGTTCTGRIGGPIIVANENVDGWERNGSLRDETEIQGRFRTLMTVMPQQDHQELRPCSLNKTCRI